MRRPLNPEDDETISEWAYRDVMAETPPRRRPLNPQRPGVDETATAESVSPNPNPSEPATKERPELTDEQLQMARERAAEVARKAGVAESFATGIASDMDLVTGRPSNTRPSGAGARARQGVADIDTQIKAARQRAQELYGRGRDAIADARYEDQTSYSRGRDERSDAIGAEQREMARNAAERQRRMEDQSFPLELEEKRARIAQLKRVPPGEDPAIRHKRLLEIKKLQAELDGTFVSPEANNQIENDVETYSKRTEGTASALQDIKTLQAAADQKDIPGVSYGYNLIPDYAEGMVLGKDQLKTRQAAKGVVGSLLRARSGTAASDAEVARIMAELGMGPNASEEEFRAGLPRLIRMYQVEVEQKAAAMRPEAKRRAQERGLVMPDQFPETGQDAAPEGEPPSVTSAEDYARVPRGAQYRAPDGSLRTKR